MTAQNISAAAAGTAAGLPAPDEGTVRFTARVREAFRSRRLVAGTCIVGFFVLLAIIGPFLAPNPSQLSSATYRPPSAAHWLGTTQTGQDVFSQLVVSTRASLEIGVAAGLLATVISVVIGITGGYLGGLLDEALSLLSNVVLVIPTFPLIIVTFAYVRQGSLTALILVIALTSWAASARVLRAQTLSVRNREYVLAARASGERAWRIVLVEILPNELPIIVSQFIFAVIFAILTQATIAFLGVVDVSQLTWGNMLYFAWNDEALQSGAWWWFIPPGACIALLGMGLALINFSMDELLNPRLRVYRPVRAGRKGAAS
ncbi:MAG: ABC transporter permease [Streptosporangiaceae bacterium]|nr:ABC transporter permease [Streptosporangiaceae bacterium]MBV9858034.1 ABC transporter permease [Streptosporangiaceae bacterium]